METLIYYILLTVGTICGTIFALQFLNMVAVIIRGRGKASLSLLMPAICAACLYLMTLL